MSILKSEKEIKKYVAERCDNIEDSAIISRIIKNNQGNYAKYIYSLDGNKYSSLNFEGECGEEVIWQKGNNIRNIIADYEQKYEAETLKPQTIVLENFTPELNEVERIEKILDLAVTEAKSKIFSILSTSFIFGVKFSKTIV